MDKGLILLFLILISLKVNAEKLSIEEFCENASGLYTLDKDKDSIISNRDRRDRFYPLHNFSVEFVVISCDFKSKKILVEDMSLKETDLKQILQEGSISIITDKGAIAIKMKNRDLLLRANLDGESPYYANNEVRQNVEALEDPYCEISRGLGAVKYCEKIESLKVKFTNLFQFDVSRVNNGIYFKSTFTKTSKPLFTVESLSRGQNLTSKQLAALKKQIAYLNDRVRFTDKEFTIIGNNLVMKDPPMVFTKEPITLAPCDSNCSINNYE